MVFIRRDFCALQTFALRFSTNLLSICQLRSVRFSILDRVEPYHSPTLYRKNNRKKIAGYGYLIYIYPVDGNNLHDGWPMLTHIVKVNGDPEKTIERINKAIEAIENNITQPSPNCPFCSYISQLNNINT